jgi:hypothetical protein
MHLRHCRLELNIFAGVEAISLLQALPEAVTIPRKNAELLQLELLLDFKISFLLRSSRRRGLPR